MGPNVGYLRLLRSRRFMARLPAFEGLYSSSEAESWSKDSSEDVIELICGLFVHLVCFSLGF